MKKELRTILTKMFSYVGADIDEVDTTKDSWFSKHEWSVKNRENFRKWLERRLRINKKTREFLMAHPSKRTKDIEAVASLFIFNYGWKIKKED